MSFRTFWLALVPPVAVLVGYLLGVAHLCAGIAAARGDMAGFVVMVGAILLPFPWILRGMVWWFGFVEPWVDE
jgi:hypothetical protein